MVAPRDLRGRAVIDLAVVGQGAREIVLVRLAPTLLQPVMERLGEPPHPAREAGGESVSHSWTP